MSSNKFLCAIVCFFFFALHSVSAQQAFVTGSVHDSANGDALVGVVVRYPGGGAVTDLTGGFNLAVPPGTLKLTFKYSGYRSDSVMINAEDGKTVRFDLKMVSESKQLDIVVVSAGKYEQNIGEVPVSMEVLRPKLIENKCTANMETIMDQVPGVTMTDGQANIRGGSGYSFGAGSRVLMVVDDMPMLSGDANDVKWNYLPVENVSQVEVMKGASSTLFGSSALNGVIHFRTAYPTLKPATTLTMFSGFYDEPRRPELTWWRNNPTFSGLNFGHARQIGNWDLVVGGHVFNDDGYRYLETEQRMRLNVNTRYRFKKVSGLTAGVNVNMMRTTGGLFILWYDDMNAYIPSDSAIQNYKNYRMNIDPFITYYSPKGHRHSLKTRYFRTDNNNDTEQGSKADFYYSEYQYQFRFKNKVTLTAGEVANYTNVNSVLYEDHHSVNLATYVQVDKKFFERLFVTVGLRGEYYKVDSLQSDFAMKFKGGDTIATLPFRPVMRAGITYQAGEATYFRISYGQGYRFPAIAEKYIRTSAAGLEIYPNLDLLPESGQSAEIGVKHGIRMGKGWKGYADFSVFWMQYSNMMEFTFGAYGNPITDPFFGLGFKSINIGSTRIRGIDVSVMGQGKIGQVEISLLAGYTYMDPQSLRWNPARDTLFQTSTENILKYRYRHIGKLDCEAGYKKFSLGVSMRCNTRMENIDKFFEQALPGIKAYRDRFAAGDLVFDTRLMYQVTERAKISLIVNNAFNREYTSRPADVQAPRNFVFQVVLKF